jgi:hypothetical protein
MDVPLLPGSRPLRLAAISHPPPTLLTAVSRLSRNGSWFSVCSISTDRTGNIAYNNSIVSCVSVAAVTWRLLSHCLAKDVSVEPLPSNGCLCWLHNSGFQQTCHSGGYEQFIFWDMKTWSPLETNRHFGGICRLHLRGRISKQVTSTKQVAGWLWTDYAAFCSRMFNSV